MSRHSDTRHSIRNIALIKLVYGKFVYVRKFYKMFIFFTTMTSIDTRKSTLNYYIDEAHRAVIFTIVQLSCNLFYACSGGRLNGGRWFLRGTVCADVVLLQDVIRVRAGVEWRVVVRQVKTADGDAMRATLSDMRRQSISRFLVHLSSTDTALFLKAVGRLRTTSTRSHPEMVGDMSRVTSNFDLSKISFVHL